MKTLAKVLEKIGSPAGVSALKKAGLIGGGLGLGALVAEGYKPSRMTDWHEMLLESPDLTPEERKHHESQRDFYAKFGKKK